MAAATATTGATNPLLDDDDPPPMLAGGNPTGADCGLVEPELAVCGAAYVGNPDMTRDVVRGGAWSITANTESAKEELVVEDDGNGASLALRGLLLLFFFSEEDVPEAERFESEEVRCALFDVEEAEAAASRATKLGNAREPAGAVDG